MLLLVLVIVAGAVLSVQAAINGRLGQAVGV
ncbi:DMT family transporter, partial [Acinetobacter bohemicus]